MKTATPPSPVPYRQGVAVRACAHVGGHTYAGNVLLFRRELDW
jgi:hypothetical protein